MPKKCYIRSNYNNYFGVALRHNQEYEERTYDENYKLIKNEKLMGFELLKQFEINKQEKLWYSKENSFTEFDKEQRNVEVKNEKETYVEVIFIDDWK